MKQITFYLDFISPYAHLAFQQMPKTLMGISHSVSYKPVLLAGMLKHYGQLGPGEIAPKREWSYRQVLWLAQSLGIELQLPKSHPFNPLSLLRLAIACSSKLEAGAPNRYVCETILNHVWLGGAEAGDAQRFESLVQQLQASVDEDLHAAMQTDAVKSQLKSNTDDAIARGVFGVPTFAVDDKLFWGLDSLPMLREYLLGGEWFDGPAWASVSQVATGVVRPR